MMQMSPEEIWDPNDPHKYYTPRDLGDNFFMLERTSTLKKNARSMFDKRHLIRDI